MHVFLIVARVSAATRIIFIEAVIVVDAIDIVSSRNLAQRALDLGFWVRGAICDWWRSHRSKNATQSRVSSTKMREK